MSSLSAFRTRFDRHGVDYEVYCNLELLPFSDKVKVHVFSYFGPAGCLATFTCNINQSDPFNIFRYNHPEYFI